MKEDCLSFKNKPKFIPGKRVGAELWFFKVDAARGNPLCSEPKNYRHPLTDRKPQIFAYLH